MLTNRNTTKYLTALKYHVTHTRKILMEAEKTTRKHQRRHRVKRRTQTTLSPQPERSIRTEDQFTASHRASASLYCKRRIAAVSAMSVKSVIVMDLSIYPSTQSKLSFTCGRAEVFSSEQETPTSRNT